MNNSNLTTLLESNLQFFLPITVGETKGWGLIDTGAARTGIVAGCDPSLIEGETSEARSAFGNETVQSGVAPRIDFLGRTFTDVDVMLAPTLHIETFEQSLPLIVRVGINLLGSAPLLMQFSTGNIGFVDLADFQPQLTIPLIRKRGLPLFALKTGTLEGNSIFDTGAGISVLNTRFFPQIEAELVEDETLATTDATGETHEIATYLHEQVSVLGTALSAARFLLIPLEGVEEGIDAIVPTIYGFEAMQNHDWLLDGPNDTLYLL